MHACKLCDAPASTKTSLYCRPCAHRLRVERNRAYRANRSGRLYSVDDNVWPRGHCLTFVEWKALAHDDPELIGAPLADKYGRRFELQASGPVMVTR